jgi:inosine triphosphate pyrophosphatase
MSPTKILFVTGNANKLREVKAILLASHPAAFDLQSQDLDLPEIQGTTREVASAKVKDAAEALGGPCITEVREDHRSARRGADE